MPQKDAVRITDYNFKSFAYHASFRAEIVLV